METSKIMDVFAYFLSEYDMEAVNALGYESRREAFAGIANRFGKKDTYLKRLRDEYDVVTSSSRNGQRNRPPRQRIIETKEYLCQLDFDSLLELANILMLNEETEDEHLQEAVNEYDAIEMTEEELENLINFKDPDATIKKITTSTKQRVYNTNIIKQIKKLYAGKCQICGTKPFDADICEIHHIEYFSTSHNNDSSNLVLLCPNHHRVIHKLKPRFDKETLSFIYEDGTEEHLALKTHLD